MKRWKFGAMSALVAMGGTAIVASSASAASPPWINQIGTSRYDGVGGVAVSSGGSVYVGGTTGGTFPGRSNVGQADAFLAKFNSSGTQRWVRQFGTKGREQVTSVAVASSGDIYVAGYTDGTFPKATNVGGVDGFLAKYSAGGTKKWVRQFGTTGDDIVRGVAVSPSGYVYVTGFTDGAFPPFANAGSTDGFLIKFNSWGTQKWATQLGTTEYEEFVGVAVSKTGDVFVTGETAGSFPTFANAGAIDGVVAKFNSAGVQQWLTQFGTASFDHSLGVAVTKTGELYVSGYTGGAFPTFVSAGASDAFVAQYNATTGVATWTRQFGTPQEDKVAGVAISKDGYVFVGGSTYGALPTFANVGGADGFMATYDATGTQLLITQFGTSANETASGVAAAKSGDPIIAGGTHGAFPGFENAGDADAYVMNLESYLSETT